MRPSDSCSGSHGLFWGSSWGLCLLSPHTSFCCCHFVLDFHFGGPRCLCWAAPGRAPRLPQQHHRVLWGRGQQGPLRAGLCSALACSCPLVASWDRSIDLGHSSSCLGPSPPLHLTPLHARHLPPPRDVRASPAAFGVGGPAPAF